MTPTNAGLRGGVNKAHVSHDAAFDCMRGYLLKTGWTQLDTRAYKPPPGHPAGSEIRVLTKRSRFGAKLRNGKEGTRNMPHVRGHKAGARGGIIVSS